MRAASHVHCLGNGEKTGLANVVTGPANKKPGSVAMGTQGARQGAGDVAYCRQAASEETREFQCGLKTRVWKEVEIRGRRRVHVNKRTCQLD